MDIYVIKESQSLKSCSLLNFIFWYLLAELQFWYSNTGTLDYLVLSIIQSFQYTKLDVMKAISGYKEIAEKNQSKSDWLTIKKTSSHRVMIATKAKQSLPKSKANEKIKTKKKWEYQRTEVTHNSMRK